MNIFTDMLFISIYLFIMIYFKLPDVSTDNYLLHKIILFVDVFCFFYAMQLIKKIKYKCKIDPYEILQQSIIYGLYVVIGYSVYTDLLRMKWSESYFDAIQTNMIKKYLMVISIIIVFVTIIQLIGLIFTKSYNCDK